MKKIDWDIVKISLMLLIVFGVLGFEIYLWVTYGNKPVDEVPAWVWWVMIGGK